MIDSTTAFNALLEQALPAAALAQRELLASYLTLVADYRQVLNLTAFASPADLVDELVVESARLLEFGALPPGLLCVDLGSGVGSPLITLAVLCPAASFIAVEARARRAAFLRQVVASLRLHQIEVRCERAEQLCRSRPHSFGLVSARAFAKPPLLMRIAAELLAPQGELRGYYGADMGPVEQSASEAGLQISASLSYQQRGQQRHVYCARRAI